MIANLKINLFIFVIKIQYLNKIHLKTCLNLFNLNVKIRNDKIQFLIVSICEFCFRVAYMYVCVVLNKCVVYKYILIIDFTIRYLQIEKSGVP